MPFTYSILNILLLISNQTFGSVSVPLIILNHFNIAILSLAAFSPVTKQIRIILLTTPLVYCAIFLIIMIFNQGEIREYEPSDSYVYDFIASILSGPNGLQNALNTRYTYDDFGYPFIRHVFLAYSGSNISLFFFKLILHYFNSYLLILIAQRFVEKKTAHKVGLFYLNASVALLYVMSGLKETIFAFLTLLTLALLQRSLITGSLISILTFFFRKVYPLILISTYVIISNRIGPKLKLILGILILSMLTYIYINTEFLSTYYRVFIFYFDEVLLFASFTGGILGGLTTIDVDDVTNYIYSPTVFIINLLMIQAITFNPINLIKEKPFLILMIFAAPLIILMQAIKVRYLAPFYGFYVLTGVKNNESMSATKFLMSLALTVLLCISWNLISK